MQRNGELHGNIIKKKVNLKKKILKTIHQRCIEYFVSIMADFRYFLFYFIAIKSKFFCNYDRPYLSIIKKKKKNIVKY